jgi:hypothetical protein
MNCKQSRNPCKKSTSSVQLSISQKMSVLLAKMFVTQSYDEVPSPRTSCQKPKGPAALATNTKPDEISPIKKKLR